VVPAGLPERHLDFRPMTAMASGIILVVAFAAFAGAATVLAVAAFRRAGARESAPDRRLSLRHDIRLRRPERF
jgi:hypothetical protein